MQKGAHARRFAQRPLFPCLDGLDEVPQPRLLVFDLDGTLIDSSRDLWTSVNAALSHVGRPSLSPEVITGFIGDGAPMLLRRALNATETELSTSTLAASTEVVFLDALTAFLDYYRVHKLDTTVVYPGVLESLNRLRYRFPGLSMAVLTNKPVNPSREICAALGLAPFFFANYGGDSFPTKKPQPEGLLSLLREAREHWKGKDVHHRPFTPRSAVMIGDSGADVWAARACGMQTLGCAYGLAPQALARSGPDRTVDSPWEWPEALGA